MNCVIFLESELWLTKEMEMMFNDDENQDNYKQTMWRIKLAIGAVILVIILVLCLIFKAIAALAIASWRSSGSLRNALFSSVTSGLYSLSTRASLLWVACVVLTGQSMRSYHCMELTQIKKTPPYFFWTLNKKPPSNLVWFNGGVLRTQSYAAISNASLFWVPALLA